MATRHEEYPRSRGRTKLFGKFVAAAALVPAGVNP
jgi:hypothetical protein